MEEEGGRGDGDRKREGGGWSATLGADGEGGHDESLDGEGVFFSIN